ncbi:MAG TPA: hypothetical protein VKF83_00915, partial [Stellaceae bacterium]|nr:hypothetical protein [Stellaceae bacterium]
MKIVKVSSIPTSAPVPEEKRRRTDLGTKIKSDATLIRVETDNGLTGIGAALGTPPIVAAIVEHELAAECVDEDPLFSERIYEKMYNGSRSRPALERGITQADESRRRGVIMEAIAGVDIAVWDVKAQALGIRPNLRLMVGDSRHFGWKWLILRLFCRHVRFHPRGAGEREWADRLDFEIDVELETGLITSHAGVPGLIEAFRQTGTAAVIDREITVKRRKRGLSASEMVESLLAMWAAGGLKISTSSGRTRRWRCCWGTNCRGPSAHGLDPWGRRRRAIS